MKEVRVKITLSLPVRFVSGEPDANRAAGMKVERKVFLSRNRSYPMSKNSR